MNMDNRIRPLLVRIIIFPVIALEIVIITNIQFFISRKCFSKTGMKAKTGIVHFRIQS